MDSRYPNIRHPQSGRPAEVTALNHHIASRGGMTSMIEKLPSQLQLNKNGSSPTQSQRIEELTRKNGYLHQKLAHHQETHCAMVTLHAKTVWVYKILQEGLQKLSQQVTGSERRLLKYWGIDLNDEGVKVTVI